MEKEVAEYIREIEKAKQVTLPRFLVGLSIEQVGEETAIDLANHFGSLEKVRKSSLEELQAIDGVGEVVGKSVFDWFRDKENARLVDRLLKHVETENPKVVSKKLSGKTFVLTGTMGSMTRDEAKREIRIAGGNVSSSVSKETDYVVAGEKVGSKLDDAKKLRVKVLSEKEFKTLIK